MIIRLLIDERRPAGQFAGGVFLSTKLSRHEESRTAVQPRWDCSSGSLRLVIIVYYYLGLCLFTACQTHRR